MKIRLTRDTVVRFAKETVLEVSESEALRLFALNNAVKVEEKKVETKTTGKKKK